MKTKYVLFCLAIFISLSVSAQTTGDFRSKSAGPADWNDFNAWEIYDGSAWQPAASGQLPGSSAAVEIQSGHTIVVNAAGLNSGPLTVNGTLTYHETTASGLTVSGNVIVNAGGSLTSPSSGTITTHSLAISGDLTVDGTFNMNVFATAAVPVTFTGATNNTISGTGATINFYSLTVNKGSAISNILDVTSVISIVAPVADGNRLTITNGTFKLSSPSSLSPYYGTQAICQASGRLWINHSSALIQRVGSGISSAAGRPLVYGTLQIDAGTFAYGSGNDLFITQGTIVLGGPTATMNIYGAFSLSSGSKFTMTDGNVNIYPQAATNYSGNVFYLETSFALTNTFTFTGGNITIVDPSISSSSVAVSFTNSYPGNITFNMNGGTIRLGDGISNKSGNVNGFQINSANYAFGHVIVNNTPSSVLTTRIVKLSGNSSISGNLTINSGSANQFLLNGKVLTIAGNIVNSGTFNGDANALDGITFNGTAQQAVSGTGTFTNGNIRNLTLNNTSGATPSVDLQAGLSVSNGLTLTSGSLGTTNASVFTIGRFTSSTSFALNRSGGALALTPTFSLGGVTIINYTYTSPTPAASITTGPELPASVSPTTLTINNASGVILSNPVSCTTLALSSGVLTATAANSVTVTGSGAGNVSGGSPTAFVNGPLIRTIPNNAAAANYRFPVGKTAYELFEFASLTTGGTGTGTVTIEAFDAGPYPGTAGTGLSSVNTNKYWSLTASVGSVTFNPASTIRLTDAGLVTYNHVAQSDNATGTYNSIGGSVSGSTITSIGPFDQSTLAAGTYFRIGTAAPLAAGLYAIGPQASYAGYTATYASVTAAIAAMTNVPLSGNLVFEFQSDYLSSVESYPMAFTVNIGSSASATVLFRPAGDVTSLINFSSTGNVLSITGADYITFDGRPGGTGSNQYLKFTTTSSTLGAIVINNNSTNNSFLYCQFKGSTTAASTGVFTSGTTLNSPLTIDHCDIDASGVANTCFYSGGGIPDLSITNSNFYNFRNGYGIYVFTGSTNAIVDNNNIYQTTSYNGFAGTTTGIYFVGITNGRVSNNNIGGSGPGLTGTWTVTNVTPAAYNFTGINATSLTTSKVYGNKIQNFDWQCTACTWTGISTGGTSGSVGTDGANYIGTGTGTENIKITSASGATQVNGITNIGAITVENNFIGGIRTFTTTASAGTSFTGISATGSASGAVNNNLVGSLTTPLSINLAAQSATGNAQNVYGILINAGGVLSITNNTIANLNNGSTVTSGVTRGIVNSTTGGNLTIANNTIFAISTSQPVIATGSAASLDGITVSTNANPLTISGNTIYDLSNSAASAAVVVNGITHASTTSVNNKIERNLIHSLKTASGTSVQNGINIANGICTVQNNVIRLGIDKDGNPLTGTIQINGISKASSTSGTFGFFFNTVYIGGTGVSAGSVNTKAFNLVSHTTEDIRDNIFINLRTLTSPAVLHYALWLPAGISSNFTCDYNIYQVSTTDGKLARFGTTDLGTMGALQASFPGNDLHSGFGDPLLTSPATGTLTMDLRPLNNTPAEATGVAIGSVTDDFTGAARSGLTPTDIGAYAGNYTPPGPGQDIWFPVISYTNLLNTGLTTNRTTVSFATITDFFTGVNTTSGTLPRLYFKKSTDANAFVGNTSSDNGWKWVEANNATSPFDFTIDYSIINGGSVSIGDSIYYFVVAQDLATIPNVTFNPANGASGASVAPTGMVAPAVPNRYAIVPTIPSSVDVGTGYTYTTLTGSLASGGLFAAINTGVITTDVVATIRTNITEPGTVGLNPITEEGPNAGTLTLTIQGDGTAHTVSGSTASYYSPLILIHGASRVTFDGGTKLLTFRNSNPAINSVGPVMQFDNGSQNCTVMNSIFESNTYAWFAAEIVVGTGVNSLTVTGNDFRDNRGANPGSMRAGLYSNNATNSLTITNNNFYNFKSGFASDPPSFGIDLAAVANGCVITGNSFYMEAGQNPICPIQAIFVGGGNGHTISGNFIGGSGPNCAGTWTGTMGSGSGLPPPPGFVGIFLSGATAPASTVQGNTIQSFNIGGANSFIGIEVLNGVANVTNNTVGSATVANSIQYSGTSSMIGLYNVTPTGVCNFDGNTVANVTFTLASGVTGMRAMMMHGGNVRKNKIYNIGSLNAAASPTIYGIWNAAGVSTNEFSNNLIALNGGNSGNPALFGFYDVSTTAGTYGFYFNSVNIYGTATGAAATYAYYRGNSAVYTMTGNILSNIRTGTGTHYAIFSNSAATLTSDYNDLYTSGAAFGSFGGSAKPNFAAWQALPQDLNSVNVNPAFVSNIDLHTTVPQVNNGGVTVAGITDDLSSVIRTSPPDIGVYEFTLPIVAINTLSATSIGQTTATINGNINTNNEMVAMSFEWGTTTAYGNSPAGTPPTVRSLSLIPVSAALSSLTPNTLYHYRIKGISSTSAETAYGLDMTFVTLPAPTITPSADPICVHTSATYTTESGNSNYVWTVSAGGSITAGGTATDDFVTVLWNAGGIQTVSVNYDNASGFPAPSPTIFNVTFNTAPVPGLTGPTSVCEGTIGQVYTTDPGMTGYVWSVTGGAIVAGGGPSDNTATIDWWGTGTGHVFVDYAGPNGCTAITPTDLPVTLNPLPVPVITGPSEVCENSTGHVYTTAALMTGYTWNVSAGGTITAGGGTTDNTVTVSWSAAGAESVSVGYTDGNGCTSAVPTVYAVTVHPILPVSVSISALPAGPVCNGISVTFTATPVNGGSIPSYQWYNGSTPVGTDSPTFVTSSLADGDVITVVMTSSEQCQSGGPATSNSITMTVRPPFTSPVAASSQVLCFGTFATSLTATPATGGSGPYGYQWQSSPDGTTNWADITGETGLTYAPGLMFATSYFRVVATDNGIPSCGSENSNVVTITVNDPIAAPFASTSQTICNNTVPALITATQASGGTGPFIYQWQMKTTGSWSNVGTNSLSYQPPALTQTTYYQVIAIDGGTPYCGSAVSNMLTITVQDIPQPGSIAADQTICSGTAPAPLTSTGAGTGSGVISYEWEISTDAGLTWNLIPGENASGYSPGVLTQNTMYHRITVSTLNSVTCRSIPTAAVTITVNPAATADFSASQLIVPTNTTVVFTDLSAGTPVTWDWSFTPGTVTYVNGTSSTSQNPEVQFTASGDYTVSLTVNGATCPNTMTKTSYIYVGIMGLWTGNVSGDWTDPLNWDNHLVPDINTDVLIPSAAPNWPVFTGNLTIGTTCKSLNLTTIASEMTVTGDLVILNGFAVDNSGTIHLLGNLDNQNTN